MYDYDFMAIGAHADDVELGCGGTIAKLISQGKKGVIIDMTTATAATRGSASIRLQESHAAAQILGINERINLELPDAHLEITPAYIAALIKVIRQYRPKVLLTHAPDDLHPDHYTTAELVKQAWYKSGLKMLHPELPAFRPERIFHFIGPVPFEPVKFCVDISQHMDQKIASVLAYKSQFYTADASQFSGKTPIASPEFIESVKSRNRHWGTTIKAEYGEAFWCRETPEIINICTLSNRFF